MRRHISLDCRHTLILRTLTKSVCEFLNFLIWTFLCNGLPFLYISYHIFPKAQVASNKNDRHHFWAQLFMLFHMVWSILFRVLALKTLKWKFLIGCWRTSTNWKVVSWPNTPHKMNHTMWKSMKNCAPKSEPFLHRTRKLPCIFAALFVCYSSRSRLRDSLLRPCFDFLLFFTTQTRPVHRETDSGDKKFTTPINIIHNPILGYALTDSSKYQLLRVIHGKDNCLNNA